MVDKIDKVGTNNMHSKFFLICWGVSGYLFAYTYKVDEFLFLKITCVHFI